jgi:fermentation-respiration switch protein FrsA (DUF1100 family)
MVITESPGVGASPNSAEEPRTGVRLLTRCAVAGATLLVGVAITAVGAGIGIRHLTKTGLTGTSMLGMALFLAGVTLLGFAGAVAWRTVHRWYRLGFIPIAGVALLAMSSVTIGTMLAFAPRTSLGSATPADRSLAYTDVEFRTSDGVRLSAWYLPSSNSAAVVTVPGSGSNRLATFDQATALARHGYGVLMIDPRGQGRSGGRAMDAGWYGDRDITAAITFLRHQPGVDPHRLGVLGLSMGGEEAIGAAAADPGIRAVVTEGATHRTAADKAGYLPHGVPGAVQRLLDDVTYGTAALLSPASPPRTLRSAIARAEGTEFLLIAAGNGVDEPEAAAHLHAAARDRVQMWTVPGASHVHGLATAPAAWTARVLTFFDRALTGTTR